MIPPSISIVIAYHSGLSYLKACLNSVVESIRANDEIIVVINNSDKSCHSVEFFEDRVKYVHYYENLGYARAINMGAKQCLNEYIIISDHDLVYSLGWIENLWALYNSSPSIGAVSCKIVNALSGNVLDYGIAFSEFNFGHPFMDLPLNHMLTSEDRVTQMICAGGLLIEKQAFLEIGGFDEAFGSLYTDLDLCLRLKGNSLKVAVCHSATAYHFAGEFASEFKYYKASFLKSDVKGAFMKKNAQLLEVDMDKYYRLSADYFIENYGRFKKYFFVNMLNVANPLWYEKVAQELNIERFDGVLRPSQKRDADNVRLFDLLGYDMMVLGVPIAYFVDRFISLKENSFWWKERRNPHSDIVIDRNGNIVKYSELLADYSNG